MSQSGKLCILAAYHEMGYVGLECILRHGWEVAAVYTHPDAPNENIWWRRIADYAKENNIPVEYADISDPAQFEKLKSYDADYLFSVYYRKMIAPAILEIFPKGAYNLHGSLLPHYRGRAPVNWVLVEGQIETGVTMHHMVAKPDAGDLVDQEWVPIEDDESASTLYQKLVDASVNVWDRCLGWFERGKAPRFTQDLTKGCYRGGRTPEDGKINFAWPAKRCFDLIRGVTHPYPGAFAMAGQQKYYIWWATPSASIKSGRRAPAGSVLLENGQPVVVCGDGYLRIDKIQPPGREEMDGAAAAKSGQLPEGLAFFASGAK
ncbi:MAG: formyltransferase [Planctomycetes bacterium]|nr:formyltransferase [Planctomycetota bacterium]